MAPFLYEFVIVMPKCHIKFRGRCVGAILGVLTFLSTGWGCVYN